jgi:F-type H+-transporting ATPase subunit delta
LLESVAESFIAQYKTLKNIQIAKVVSAVPLTNELRDKVIALVKGAVKANEIEIEEKVDPEIIGGLIVRVGDRQVDESIKRKILDLEKAFSQNQYIKQY